jgi:integrase
MAKEKLTKTRIEKLTKPGVYSDGAGLFLRVRSGGSKSWHFIWKKDGKRSELALGPYPGFSTRSVTIDLAREKAQKIRDMLARGQEVFIPGAEPTKDERPTFESIMEDVIKTKTERAKNEKHKAQWGMTLRVYAEPLHKKPIADITIDDVLKALEPIWSSKPETANRTRMRIEAVFQRASALKIFTGDNPARWAGGLKELLPPRDKLSRGHHEAIEFKNLPAVMPRLRNAAGVSARAVEFACLTAARSGEVRFMVFEEVDFANAVWTVPAERMKAGREHRVPLSTRAVEILKAQQLTATSNLVFEGGKERTAISDTAMVKALRSASGGSETLHGLRSSFRDWAGDASSHSREVIETALAHIVKDKTEAAYRRSDALEKRRVLMQDWANYCG